VPNILIVDNNPETLAENMKHLTGEGYEVTAADTGIKAVVCLNEKQYDCIVTEIMLPDIDGFALCKAARAVTAAPVIFLTCLDEPTDKINGLMHGGDDYITKPCSLEELSARIHAHLRREQRSGRHIYLGEVYIDRKNRMIQTPEESVFLAQKEFDLFMMLFENPGKMYPKDVLLNALWPKGTDIGTVAVHILKLRRKLDFAKTYIGTIKNDYKSGYYLSPYNTSDDATPVISQIYNRVSVSTMDVGTLIGVKGNRKSFNSGDIIIVEDDADSDCMYFLIDGSVEVHKFYGQPKQIQLATLNPGDLFGEIALFLKEPRTASVVAKTDVNVLEVRRTEMRQFFESNMNVAYTIVETLCVRIKNLLEDLEAY